MSAPRPRPRLLCSWPAPDPDWLARVVAGPDDGDDDSWRDELDHEPHEPAESATRGPLRVVQDGETPIDPREEDLLRKLILDIRVDRRTGDETYVIRPTPANVSTILTHHPAWAGVVALDTFAGRIVTTRVPPWHPLDAPQDAVPGAWTDADTARLVHWLARTRIGGLKPITIGPKTVDAAILVAAEANKIHPVRDYLGALRWDGERRVASLASRYFGAEDTPYHRAVGTCFLVGAVARVMQPGCKLDTCTIFEGAQGTLKSTALATLAGEWFTDSKIPIGEKDAYQMIRGVWIAELAELASLSKSDVETIKAFLSSRVDRYRPSYGRHEVEVPRQTVFAGTTNASTYLHDVTGARRFPAIRTGRIDIDALARDRDQIWAEAVVMYRSGAPWWLTGELADTAAEEAEHRYVRHPWEAPIADYLASPARRSAGVTTEELLAHCGVDTAHRTTASAMIVGGILTRLGWERRRQRVAGTRCYRYFPASEGGQA